MIAGEQADLGGAWRHSAIRIAAIACLGVQGCSPQASPLDNESASEQPIARTQSGDGEPVQLGGVGTAYPSTLYPQVWAGQQQLMASDPAAVQMFGVSLALSGDVGIIGATGDKHAGDLSGAAYVFVRNASTWSEKQKLTASDAFTGDRFGRSVAISGNVAIIGASGDDDTAYGAGSAYVFVRDAAAWSEQQKLTASVPRQNGSFGQSMTMSPDTVLIGAGTPGGAGSAYVFVRNADTWSEHQELTASDSTSSSTFGTRVALSGDTALFGVGSDDDLGINAGAAYVFARSAGNWSEQQKLRASDGEASSFFGAAAATSGDVAIVGAFSHDNQALADGSAYVFVRNASTWSEKQKLTASAAEVGDNFGAGLAMNADMAVIGAVGDDEGTTANAGSAYVFGRTADTWIERQRITATKVASRDTFGSRVALSGNAAFIAAPRSDDAGSDSGSVYAMALLLVAGQPCSAARECANERCIDGYCCDTTCDGECEMCNLAGLEGSCATTPRGSVPSRSCAGSLCDGTLSGCPGGCSGDGECTPEYYCLDAIACAPKAADGEACIADKRCVSGHCVDGVCCAQACDEGCGSCVTAGREGTCTPLDDGQPGAPSCTPYLCTGTDTGCPTSCREAHECSPQHHCNEGVCKPDGVLGDGCADNAACASQHCTDGVCCTAASCGAYRCGPAGACEAACSSSAQCASGHACDSGGECEAQDASGDSRDGGGCHIANEASRGPHSPRWLAGLGLLVCLGGARRRKRSG